MKEATPNGILRHTADKEEQIHAASFVLAFFIEALTKEITYYMIQDIWDDDEPT